MSASFFKAAFLGPKGENAVEMERLLREVLHDHVFWRRNFHPSDARLVEERDKQTEHYGRMVARLRDELYQILAELKRGAPLYSPRQVGHMVSDPTLPALVGYFAGMLYNQNNVVAEAAPETVRKEHVYLAALARMLGYPELLPEVLTPEVRRRRTAYSWGHLCSGGTLANLEALWVARNVRFYPLAVRLLAATHPDLAACVPDEVGLGTGERVPLAGLSTFELANLPVPEVTDLHLRIREALHEAGPEHAQAFDEAVPSVRRVGLASFLEAYNAHFPHDPCKVPKVLISQAAHYGWSKGMDVVGLGVSSLVAIPVDRRVHVDVDALEEELRKRALRKEPVLAVVSICGTTEEGAVDPLHRIEALRRSLAPEGVTFWHHCDAAFGGFFAAMLPRDEQGGFRPYDEGDEAVRAVAGPGGVLTEAVYRSVAAMARTDSLTVDPHKFGYIPYPGGAVLFRDYHVRDAVSFGAPYLATDQAAGFGGFLGQWTLEGSRPGAAAVSCYLSQAVVPLTEEAHGRLVKNCFAATRALVAALRERFSAENGWITLRPLAEPDTVGFCFLLAPRDGMDTLAHLNDFTRRLWTRMTVDGREDINQYAFLVSKTEVPVAPYRHVLASVLEPDVLAAAPPDASLMLLRIMIMNPFLDEWNERQPSFARAFGDYVYSVAADAYPEQVLSIFRRKHGGRRLQVLVIEPDPAATASLTQRIQFDPAYAAYVDVHARTPDMAGGGHVTGGPEVWHRVVLDTYGTAEDEAAETVRRLLEEAGLRPQQLFAIVPGHGGPGDPPVSAHLGIPACNVLTRATVTGDVKVLMQHLCRGL